jgi:putative spermidine/putrescine transport system permease protein
VTASRTLAAPAADWGVAPPPFMHALRAWPLLPLLIFSAVFFIYPVAQILWLSLIDPAGTPTLAYFTRALTTPVYARTLAITLQISAWTTVFSLLAGYPVAYLLATSRAQTRDWLTLLVLMPFWTSFLVRTFAWMILLGRNGAVNRLLIALGLTDAPLALIFNMTGVMIGMVHSMMPLGVIAMLSVMQRVDLRLVSAARTLGAGGGNAFWRVFFRLSLPGVASAGLLVFVSSLGFFITPALLGGRRQTMISQVIIAIIQEVMDWHFAGALAVLLLAVSTVIFVLYDRLVGLSSLSGGAASDAARRPGALGRAAAALGAALTAAVGTLCDAAGAAWQRLLQRDGSRPSRGVSRGVLVAVCALVIAFLIVPSLFVIPVSFTSGSFITFPPRGFSLRWYGVFFGSADWVAATERSFLTALLTGIVATMLGTAAAFVLVRQRVLARGLLLAIILAPLVLPRIIIAVGLFYLYAHIGLVGTVAGLVIGHTILAVPYVLITVMAVLRTYDEQLDQAAWSMGASRWRTLIHITLPQIRGGLIAGFLFAFITSFDELTIALFVTGGGTATLPRRIWDDLLLQVNPTLAAVSTVVLVFVTVFIVGAELLRRRGAAQ